MTLVCLPFAIFGEDFVLPLLASREKQVGALTLISIALLACDSVAPVPATLVIMYLAAKAGWIAGIVGGTIGLCAGVFAAAWIGRSAVGRLAPKFLPEVRDAPPMTGDFTAREEFGRADLGPEWMTMRAAPYALDRGELVLAPGRDGLGDLGKPAFVARRQQHDQASAETQISFSPGEGEMAGLAALQNDDYFLTFAVVREADRTLVRVARRAGRDEPRTGVTVAETPIDGAGPVRLRMTIDKGSYDFAYATSGEWRTLATDVDATHLSTRIADGFVGTMIGPFAQGPRAD